MDPIYADHAATTPCAPEVVAVMTEVLAQEYGNPSSRHYALGRQAQARLDTARQRLAHLLQVDEDGLTFTSGATEACNLAVLGVMARSLRERPGLVVLASEHPAVLGPTRYCAAAGAQLTEVPVDAQGQVDLAALDEAVDDRTALVCAMLVNNETGVVQDLPTIAELAHARGALLFCDATQALCRHDFATADLGCDLLACSAHKCYGPKGVGLLWQRRGLALQAQILGGGQEQERRSGTENVAGIAGFGAAAGLLIDHRDSDIRHLRELTQALEDGLRRHHAAIVIHGSEAERAPGISFISHPEIDRGLLAQCHGLCLSSGSSCASANGKVSHVLQAMGCSTTTAGSAVRVSLGRGTSNEDISIIVDRLTAGIDRLLSG